MKSSKFAKVFAMALVSTLALSACLEQKKTDDSSTTDDSGGGTTPTPTPTPTYSCTASGSSGFNPATSAAYLTGLTPGSNIKTISFWFRESTSANLGTVSMTMTAIGCTFGGSTLEALTSQTVTTTMVSNNVQKTFTFSGSGITVPDCGSGTGTVIFEFTNFTRPNNSTTFYMAAQNASSSSCAIKVTNSTSGTPAWQGVYNYVGSVTP